VYIYRADDPAHKIPMNNYHPNHLIELGHYRNVWRPTSSQWQLTEDPKRFVGSQLK
jgi:hypothetical protein